VERWKPYVFILNVGTFIAVAIYACITHRMWKEMQEQTRIQRTTGINTERAWLGLDADLPIRLKTLKLGPPRFEVIADYRIKNFGHGPAFKIASFEWVTTDSTWLEDDKWRDARFGCVSSMNYTEGTIPVGGTVQQPPPMGRILFLGQILERPMGQPGDPFIGPSVPNAKFVWFFGCITYKDQFGASHWTRFCLLTPEWTPHVVFDEHVSLHMYGLWNDTDDDTKGKKTQK
jgi:hypothetical protein